MRVDCRRNGPPALLQVAEKPEFGTAGAEALTEKNRLIAALEALRHPKSELYEPAKSGSGWQTV
jgi:hypothetical protein